MALVAIQTSVMLIDMPVTNGEKCTDTTRFHMEYIYAYFLRAEDSFIRNLKNVDKRIKQGGLYEKERNGTTHKQ